MKKKEPKKFVKCESIMCCKATASLEAEIKEEIKKEDQPLEDILIDDSNKD